MFYRQCNGFFDISLILPLLEEITKYYAVEKFQQPRINSIIYDMTSSYQQYKAFFDISLISLTLALVYDIVKNFQNLPILEHIFNISFLQNFYCSFFFLYSLEKQ